MIRIPILQTAYTALSALTLSTNLITATAPTLTSSHVYHKALKSADISAGVIIPSNTSYALGNAHISNGIVIQNGKSILVAGSTQVSNGIRTRSHTTTAIQVHNSRVLNSIRIGAKTQIIVHASDVSNGVRLGHGHNTVAVVHGAIRNSVRIFDDSTHTRVQHGIMSNGLRYGNGSPHPVNNSGQISNGGRSRYHSL